MPVNVSNDAFTPHRGLDEAILNYPVVNGNVYFAWDTKKMYFDANGERHALGGDGIHFVYGSANPDEVAVDQATNYYMFPRIKIDATHYLVDDIIINKDGTFYRIKEIAQDYVMCEKLLVSGTGGGGGDGSGITFNAITPFPASYPYNNDITGKFIVFDAYGGTNAIIYISYYDNAQAAEPRLTESITVPVGQEFDITLKAKNLKPGDNNYLSLYAIVDGEESRKRTYSINCVDLVFGPAGGWDPKKPFEKGASINFPYIISSQSGSIPDDLKVEVECRLEGVSGTVKETLTKDRGEISLLNLFSGAPQGGYDLYIKAKTVISGVEVTIGDLFYGIAYNTFDPEKIMIWANYNKTEEENYTIIDIPFMVLDPAGEGKAEVDLIVNGEIVGERTVVYSSTEWEHWEISDYLVGQTNEFIIQCKDAQKIFRVTIVKNHAINLDAISDGCGLYLTTRGRTNTERASKRAAWDNRATISVPEFNLAPVELKNFNWYNNGWIKTTADGIALRITNGASVKIPITTMVGTDAQPRAYEFDFRVRNPVNFSKLVTSTMVKQEDGTEKLVKSVSDGEGAFLKYYDANTKRGFMLGTRDAFFALNATDIVNVKYASDQRIKISIVVDTKGKFTPAWADSTGALSDRVIPFVYVYINGVLSGIQNFSVSSDLQAPAATAIEINSEFCDVDLFNIRVYNIPLNYSDITQNWVGDAPTLAERKDRYNQNQALVKDNKLDYELVRKSNLIPVMVVKTYDDADQEETNNRLPYQKGTKKCVGVRFFDPEFPEKSFHCENVEIDVQGTSSQGYPRRNYKLKTKEKIEGYKKHPFKFEKWDGNEANRDYWYQDHLGDKIGDTVITEDLIKSMKLKKINIGNGTEENTFCLKADYMESSSTHNTCLANMIQFLSPNKPEDTYNFGHPLKKDFYKDVDYRTTIYGFPCLLFHENASGEIVYVGKYNFNLDKGATGAFGFSVKETNPHSAKKIHQVWVKNKETGEDELVTETTERQSTFAEIAECWEFTQNQTGLGKFQCSDKEKGFFEITATGDNKGRLEAYSHFENRYHYMDFDMEKSYPKVGIEEGNRMLTEYSQPFAKMWSWVYSTDTTTAPNTAIEDTYYPTLDAEYVEGRDYYLPGTTEKADIHASLTFEYEPEEEEPNANVPEINQEQFRKGVERYLGKQGDDSVTLNELAGSYSFTRVTEADNSIVYKISKVADDGTIEYMTAAEFGVTVPASNTRALFNISGAVKYDGFNASLCEKFTTDSARYRKAKFKNEFTQHFDLDYVLMYFIITELLLLYDSRQKNMMIATWGPTSHTEDEDGNIIPGNHIWYPIFYDMDTQLGVNNSGQVYWDYDEDATPTELDENGNLKHSSIFSGNGSVLWNNVILCFEDQIRFAYRQLRRGGLSVENLCKYYNEMGSDKWTQIMKNIDADYKYIQPAVSGYTDQGGAWAQTSDFFYCLQGDRKLNRESFFEYRINYIDSQWLGGAYDPTSQAGAAVQMRFNANDPRWTSDDNKTPAFEAEASYQITPFLSQYVSALYDEMSTEPQRFDVNGDQEYVQVNPPQSIQDRLNDGYTLSQQLVYIRGPQYLSDMGDLSLKYLNEFWSSAAVRLRRLKIGNSTPGYKNLGLTSAGFKLASEKGNSAAKELLNYLDITNLSALDQELDIGGCIKLETLKALGTNLPKIVLPEGNLLSAVYLPNTLQELRLVKPLELKNVLTEAPMGEAEPKGLYIQGLTDKMRDPVNSSLTQKINLIQLDDTKLGLGSFYILNHLYLLKKLAQDNVATGTSKFLRLSATNVEWSPYIMVEQQTSEEDARKLGQLYELVNNVVYEPYTFNSDNWEEKNNNGLIFYKDAEFDCEAITELGMVKRFVDDKEDGTVTILGQNYYFAALDDDPSAPTINKVLPTLSGRMHINNENGAVLDEGELFNRYGKHYPDLHITADKIIESYRTHFVEYLEDGTIKDLGWQKVTKTSQDSTKVRFLGEKPSRLHYDFVGWARHDITALKDEGDVPTTLYKRHSIITEEEQESLTKKGLLLKTEQLDQLDMANEGYENLIMVAVYVIHGYDMTFIGNFRAANGQPARSSIVVKIPAGTPVIPPTEIPYLDDTDPAQYKLTECNRFIGWNESSDASLKEAQDLSKIIASTELTFYAKFVVDSVYNNPLTADQLNWKIVSDMNNWDPSIEVPPTGLVVGVKPTLGLGGKICFPAELTVQENGIEQTLPIIGIAGDSWSESGESNGLTSNASLYAVFFQGCEEKATKICHVRSFANKAFYQCENLYYIDIPESLQILENSCLRNCYKLFLEDLKNVRCIYMQCLQYTGKQQPENDTLIIPGDAPYYDGIFTAYGGWKTIQLGSQAHPVNKQTLTEQLLDKVIIGEQYEEAPITMTKVIIVYNPASVTEEEIRAAAPLFIGCYDKHQTATDGDLLTFMTATT